MTSEEQNQSAPDNGENQSKRGKRGKQADDGVTDPTQKDRPNVSDDAEDGGIAHAGEDQ